MWDIVNAYTALAGLHIHSLIPNPRLVEILRKHTLSYMTSLNKSADL